MLYRSMCPAVLPTRPKLPQQDTATQLTGKGWRASAWTFRRFAFGWRTCSPRVKCCSLQVYADGSPSWAVMTLAQSRSLTWIFAAYISTAAPAFFPCFFLAWSLLSQVQAKADSKQFQQMQLAGWLQISDGDAGEKRRLVVTYDFFKALN